MNSLQREAFQMVTILVEANLLVKSPRTATTAVRELHGTPVVLYSARTGNGNDTISCVCHCDNYHMEDISFQ